MSADRPIDGFDRTLSPYQSLMLFALSAILARSLGLAQDKNHRHKAIVHLLWNAAQTGRCQGHIGEQVDVQAKVFANIEDDR